MASLTEKDIQSLTRTIVQRVHPEKILLFGSRARGTAKPASDVDLLIVEKKPFGPNRSRRREMARLWHLLSPFPFSADILVYSRKEFEYFSDSLNHVVGRAVREGRVLYERH